MQTYFRFNKTDYPAGSKIVLPFGLRKAKFRVDASTVIISEIDSIGPSPINQVITMEFPTVDGKSPNTFTISNWAGSATTLFINVESIGGVPDNKFFDALSGG